MPRIAVPRTLVACDRARHGQLVGDQGARRALGPAMMAVLPSRAIAVLVVAVSVAGCGDWVGLIGGGILLSGVLVKNGTDQTIDWEYLGARSAEVGPQGATGVRPAQELEFVPVPNFGLGERTCTINPIIATIDGEEIDRAPPGFCSGDEWIIDGEPGEPRDSKGPSATDIVPSEPAPRR